MVRTILDVRTPWDVSDMNDSVSMFVSSTAIYDLTHRRRFSAQAKVLDELGMKCTRRPDGSVALRQEELDRFTLSCPRATMKKRQDWRPSLSVLDKAGSTDRYG